MYRGDPAGCVQGVILQDVYREWSCRMWAVYRGDPAGCVQGVILHDVYRG